MWAPACVRSLFESQYSFSSQRLWWVSVDHISILWLSSNYYKTVCGGFLPRANWVCKTFVSGSLRFRKQTPQVGGGFVPDNSSSYSSTSSWVASLAEHVFTSSQIFIYKQLSRNTADRVIFASVLVHIALPYLRYWNYCFNSVYNGCAIKRISKQQEILMVYR